MTTTHNIDLGRLNLTFGDFRAVQEPSIQVGRGELSVVDQLAQRSDTAERVLRLVDLEHRADISLRQFSGGDRRRLDFAAAVYASRDLVSPDEPTTGQDVQSCDDLWGTVDRFRESITQAMHHLEEAQRLVERIGLMQPDLLHHGGTVSELMETSPYVIRFSLAASPPESPPQSRRESDGTYVIESVGLQRDIRALLMWAEDHSVQLRGLSIGPSRLADALRGVDTDHTAA